MGPEWSQDLAQELGKSEMFSDRCGRGHSALNHTHFCRIPATWLKILKINKKCPLI